MVRVDISKGVAGGEVSGAAGGRLRNALVRNENRIRRQATGNGNLPCRNRESRLVGWLWRRGLLLAAGAVVALAVRYPLLAYESKDYVTYLRPWYDHIVANGYWSALGEGFSNYPPAYLYVLVALAKNLAWLPTVIAIKSASILGDFVLAFFVYKCVAVGHPRSSTMPALAFVATLLAPVVVLNSAMWGQVDAVYTAFLVACLYCLLAGRQGWACAAFGMALAFKLQAVFLAPLFLWLLVKKAVNWRWFVLAPAVVIASFVPAWLAGLRFDEPLWSYVNLVTRDTRLTVSAPNLYVWIADLYGSGYGPPAPMWLPVLLAAFLVVAVACVVRRARRNLTDTGELVVLLATFSVLLLPYVLPGMRERYFYPAAVFTIALTFFRPAAYAYALLVVGSVSLLAYFPYLFGFGVPPEPLSVALFAVLVALALQALRLLGCRVRGAVRRARWGEGGGTTY